MNVYSFPIYINTFLEYRRFLLWDLHGKITSNLQCHEACFICVNSHTGRFLNHHNFSQYMAEKDQNSAHNGKKTLGDILHNGTCLILLWIFYFLQYMQIYIDSLLIIICIIYRLTLRKKRRKRYMKQKKRLNILCEMVSQDGSLNC